MRLLVNIDVDDLERAERFYSALGLCVSRRLGAAGVEMLGDGVKVYLLAKPAGSRPARGRAVRRTYRRHWTPVHLDFVTDDIEAAVRRAQDAGAVVEQPIRPEDWGSIAVLSDPFGHGFCILQFTASGYDAPSDQP